MGTLNRRISKILATTPSRDEVKQLIPGEGSNSDYKKYILFGHQRCGSSVLTSGLESHGNMKSFAEVFTPDLITFNYSGYDNKSIPLIKYRDKHPISFLEDVIFNGQDDNIEAVGFKVFPDQIVKSRFECVWEWISNNEDVSLIMLNRENSLKTLCSVQIAKKTGVWGIKDASKRPTLTLKLSPKQCEKFFEKRERYGDLVREKFKHSNLLEINYETFSENIPYYLLKSQEHMGLNPVEFPVNDIKKEVRPLKEIITNYNHLEKYFTNTRWENFFSL